MSHVCDGSDPACASCQASARRLVRVRGAMTVDDDLDDIRRARIWTQLEDRLAEGAPAQRAWRSWAFGGAAAAAVAAAAIVALWPHRDELHTLSVPVDTTVESQLGPHTTASIVGPAELELLAGAGDAAAVRLRRGTLLAEFEGGAGRSLRIETRGAVVEVVGTLFAVEVRGGTTCTSVLHGRVRMTMPAGAVFVGGGERHCSGDAAGQPILDEMRAALLRHGERHALVARPAEIAAARNDGDAAAPLLGPVAPPPPAAVRSPQAPDRSPPAVSRSPHPAGGSPRTAPRLPLAASPAPPADVRPPPAAPGSPEAGSPTAPPGGAPSRSGLTGTSSRGGEPRSDGGAAPGIATSAPTPADVAPRPPAPVAAPRPAPDELYRSAEAALAARDLAAADRSLAALVAEYPSSALVDEALYERARIAYQQRAWGAARDHLAQLAAMSSAQFAEAGHYLRCRVAVETGESSAPVCLIDYRARFPRSPHDLDALALLVQLAHASQGCRGAAALIDELVQSYPRTTLAAAWRGRCPEAR